MKAQPDPERQPGDQCLAIIHAVLDDEFHALHEEQGQHHHHVGGDHWARHGEQDRRHFRQERQHQKDDAEVDSDAPCADPGEFGERDA